MKTVAVMLSEKRRGREELPPYIARGIERCGDRAVFQSVRDYREPIADAAIFYGLDGKRGSKLHQCFEDYRSSGRQAVYIDIGYWPRRKLFSDRYQIYHRFAVNDRHPTAYFQKFKHHTDRIGRALSDEGKTMKPWNGKGRNIIVCGMSEKCAVYEGFAFEQWERAALEKLRALTDRPIYYRPKPQRRTKPKYPPIKGFHYSDPSKPFLAELEDAWAVVSHHSNCGIDAILAGVPCFQEEGVASVMGWDDLGMIESPIRPDDVERWQFAADVAYCEFNRAEMADGTAWKHLKSEGLV